MVTDAESVFARVKAALEPSDDGRPNVLMTCGLAGMGKTTLSKNILARLPGYIRLSIDEIVAENHGLYGKDYAASMELYNDYQDEAEKMFLERLEARLAQKKNAIVDRSLYAREDRDAFKKIVAEKGGRWVLVYLRVSGEGKEALWDRICARSAGERDANSALDISRELFEAYWKGFEGPNGEGEIVIDVL